MKLPFIMGTGGSYRYTRLDSSVRCRSLTARGYTHVSSRLRSSLGQTEENVKDYEERSKIRES